MDLEVVGRHTMLFDDDGMSAFVNSSDALVQWNSLFIDRYDVRHLLSGPLPPRSRRRHSDDSLESELDRERYLDLPSDSDQQDADVDDEAERENIGGYTAVPFSYGNPSELAEQKNADEPAFRPPFSVPEHLLLNLPTTEKIHQIIARTALFVSKHGGQSEIVLRVKQGDNPTFGFLMPDHDLHPYFRFLVDNQELVKSDADDKSMEEDKAENKFEGVGGALSLLGSVYGSGEDEDGGATSNSIPLKSGSVESGTADSITDKQEQADGAKKIIEKDEEVSKHPILSLKEKSHVVRKNRSIGNTKATNASTTTSLKQDGDSLGSDVSSAKLEAPVLEPPSDMKRVVEKIVEFIIRNGKEFETILLQQDTKYGRFPFLLPSNQYNPYYKMVLENAQESWSAGKGFNFEKHDSLRQGVDRKGVSSESDSQAVPCDIPNDSDRKEKFKMVIGKLKKESQEASPKAIQVGVSVDAAAAAAILQAATKGISKPNLDLLSRGSLIGSGKGPNSEGSSNSQVSFQKPDFSETSLSGEQKLKAERLKRAKMFAAMIKGGAASFRSEHLRGASAEPPASQVSGSSAQVENFGVREREGSSTSLNDITASIRVETSGNKESSDNFNERRSKRIYRSRSKMDEEEEDKDDEEERGEEEDKGRDRKHSKRSRHSSHHSTKDGHKHRKRRSFSKNKDSRHHRDYDSVSDEEERSLHRHRRKHEDSSEDEHRHSRYRSKHDTSSDDVHRHSKYRSKHGSSSEDERSHSRYRSKRDSSSNDEDRHSKHRSRHRKSSSDGHKRKHNSSTDDGHVHENKSKSRKRSHAERDTDPEEGEILAKLDPGGTSECSRGVSREASVDVSKSGMVVTGPPEPSQNTMVSDDLRAKIRAMLMETL